MICYLTFTLLDWPGIFTARPDLFHCRADNHRRNNAEAASSYHWMSRWRGHGAAGDCLRPAWHDRLHRRPCSAYLSRHPSGRLDRSRQADGRLYRFSDRLRSLSVEPAGHEPKFDLTIVRDRTIGICLAILLSISFLRRCIRFPCWLGCKKDIVQLISQCRTMLKSISEPAPAAAICSEVAEVQASLDGIRKIWQRLDMKHAGHGTAVFRPRRES